MYSDPLLPSVINSFILDTSQKLFQPKLLKRQRKELKSPATGLLLRHPSPFVSRKQLN